MFAAITEPGTIQVGISQTSGAAVLRPYLIGDSAALANRLLGDEEFGEAEFVVEGGECALH